MSDGTHPDLAAYCWPQSIVPGEPVELFVTRPTVAGPVDVMVTVVDAANVANDTIVEPTFVCNAPVRPDDVRVFDRGCRWPTVHRFDTTGWSPGMHLVAVTEPGTSPDHSLATAWAYVVVRPPQPLATRVLMLASNTWNAYNDVGGENYYTDSQRQSFRRPQPAGFLRKASGSGERYAQTRPGMRAVEDFLDYSAEHGYTMWHGGAGFAAYEERFLRWAAAEAIAVDVVLDRDVHASPGLLDGYDVAISVGHDEYTTWEQRDALDAMVGRGGRIAFMSGNAHYWQVRHETADGGTPADAADLEAMVCWKHRYEQDPVFSTEDRSRLTSIWSDPLVGRPENELTGVSFVRGGYARMASRIRNGSGGYTIHRPDHWLLAGTQLGWGDVLGAAHTVVGYECDGCDMTLVDGIPTATGADGTPDSFEVVATSPVQPFDESSTLAPLADGGRYEAEFHAERMFGATNEAAQFKLSNGYAVLGAWTHPSGGVVSTTGCTDWVFGLADPDVAQITRTMIGAAKPATVDDSSDGPIDVAHRTRGRR